MNAVFRFDGFLLCPARRELKRDDALIDLPASAFDCLVYLVQHRERAVGRDELISAVWGRSEISESLLPQTIVRIRRVLGDEEATAQRSIRTITRFGYHWVAETTLESSMAHEAATPRGAAAVVPVESSDDSGAAAVIVMPADVDEAAIEAEWMRLGIMDLVGWRLRRAKVLVTRTEDVVVLLHVFPALAQARADNERELPLRVPRRVYPAVRQNAQAWHVELTSRDERQRVTVTAAHPDVTIAARKAVDDLLQALNAAA